MSAPTTTISGTSTALTTTGEGNGLLKILPTVANARLRVGFSGTFTGTTVAIRGRLRGINSATTGGVYYPMTGRNVTTGAAVADSSGIALTDSTAALFEFAAGLYDQVEIYASAGTLTAVVVEERVEAAVPNEAPLVINSTAGQQTFGGNTSVTGTLTVTSTSASAATIGANGATNPVLKVNANTASVATGVSITGAAAAGGLAVAVISSGTNENLTIDAKGSGTITLGGTSTGTVTIGSSLTVSAKNIITDTSTGTKIGTATTQKLGFFNASPVVQPAANTDTSTGAAGSVNAVFLNTTFVGSGGTAAYSIGGVVTALKALGLLAA